MAFTEILDLVDRFLEITLAFFTRVRKLLGFGKIGVWRNNNEISSHKGVIYFQILTAGRAKNDIANTEKQEATIFPVQVRGTVSPYPMVVTVIWKIRQSLIWKVDAKSRSRRNS